MIKKIEAKEKAAKAKKRAAGRGIEGKYVYSMRDVAKYIENEALFEHVNLMLLQGYVWRPPFVSDCSSNNQKLTFPISPLSRSSQSLLSLFPISLRAAMCLWLLC